MRDTLLNKVAWVGQVQGPVRGLIVRFYGLGSQNMKSNPEPLDLEYAAHGGLVIEPFHGPWAWMNDLTRDLYDDVIDAVRARHGLSDKLPLIALGGSMGGHGALAYTFRSRQRVTACQANCPVADLPFHYTERPDLPRTLHHAFGSYEDISLQLTACSPLHQVAQMPDIAYQIIHGERDKAVNKARHSDRLVAAMRARELLVDYVELPEMEHCQPFTWPAYRRSVEFVIGQLKSL